MGDLILQGPWRPTAILGALESLASPAVTELRIAVAYTTYGGCDELLPRLAERIGRKRWSQIPKTVITSIDFHLTEPRALEYLLSQGVTVRLSSLESANFHSKLYAFMRGPDVHVFVGSANLTLAALNDNVEAATVTRVRASARFARAWAELLATSIELTGERLKEYAAKRRSAPPRVRVDRTVRRPRAVPAARLAVFSESVAAGTVNPLRFNAFWVDVGSVSGGSGNQLELPREAHRFFGLKQRGQAHLIGAPVLVSAGREWKGRKLTWHGQGKMNQMERLNLPTRKEGGFQYANMVILFTRVGSRYRLTVAAPGSPFASAWRAASRKVGHEYKLGLGKRSTRVCGLF